MNSPSAASDLATRPIAWRSTGDAVRPYVAAGDLSIRVNDFPAERLYTLLENGVERLSFDQWPAWWQRDPITADQVQASTERTQKALAESNARIAELRRPRPARVA